MTDREFTEFNDRLQAKSECKDITCVISKKIEGDVEYLDKLRMQEILYVIKHVLTVGKSKKWKDLNNALIYECHVAKPRHINQTSEILEHLYNTNLIDVDADKNFTLNKSFNFYIKNLHRSIIEYRNRVNKERLGFSYHSFESERKAPLTEEQKKELEKTLGDKLES
jgi:hypothetical protein